MGGDIIIITRGMDELSLLSHFGGASEKLVAWQYMPVLILLDIRVLAVAIFSRKVY